MAEITLPFRTLLYRYFFFDWLFKDVSRGNLYERSAAWRHNQEQAMWLKTYMRRWAVGGALLFLLGALFESILQLPGMSAFFYVPSVLALPVNAVIGVCWAGLKLLPFPF